MMILDILLSDGIPYLGALGALGLVAVLVAGYFAKRREAARRAERDAALKAAAEALDAGDPAGRGFCRFCPRRADYRMPAVRLARPWGDRLARRRGMVPVPTLQLRLPRELHAGVDLCALHADEAASRLGAEVVAVNAELARFHAGLVRRLVEFQNVGLAAALDSAAAATAAPAATPEPRALPAPDPDATAVVDRPSGTGRRRPRPALAAVGDEGQDSGAVRTAR